MVSEKIKELRKQVKMSQETMADKLNVSRQAVTKWETGAGVPDVDNLIAIANLFQISLDELVGNTMFKADEKYLFQSNTEYDIDAKKDFDITFMGAKNVVLRAYEGEKVKVLLASNQISNIQKAFKVKIDDIKKRIDIDVKRLEGVSEMDAKASLIIDIAVPASYTGKIELEGNTERFEIIDIISENIEFSGKVKNVICRRSDCHAELNTNEDMELHVESVTGRIDINQVSATSKMYLPIDIEFAAYAKGIANHIFIETEFTNMKKISDEPSLAIELNGMKSELAIYADSRNQDY